MRVNFGLHGHGADIMMVCQKVGHPIPRPDLPAVLLS